MYNYDYSIESNIDSWTEADDLNPIAHGKMIVLRILSNRLKSSKISADSAQPIFKLFRKILSSEGRLTVSE